MNIVVMPRFMAEEQSRIDFASDKAIISITTPTDDVADIDLDNKSIVDILRLEFVDAEKDDAEQFPEGWIFTKEQAEEIYNFVTKVKDCIECLWIHCDGGVSRSAAVAAAILKALTGNDSDIFNSKDYFPNMTVYTTTLEVFMNHLYFEN